jgi:hypothetical protein
LDKAVAAGATETETLRKPLEVSLEIFEPMALEEMTLTDILVSLSDLEKPLLTEFKKLSTIEFEVAMSMIC